MGKKLLYLLPPFLLILLLLPLVEVALISIPTLMLGQDSIGLTYFLPIYLGLISLPGYFYIVLSDAKKGSSNHLVFWWVRTSLALAIISCLYGACLGLALPIVIPIAVMCSIVCARLLYRFEKS